MAATNNSAFLSAVSLSSIGATPQRWFADWARFETGLMDTHTHVYVVNPHEDLHGQIFNIWCKTCSAQFNFMIDLRNPCPDLVHHMHTEVETGTVIAECCHCGLVFKAIREEPTIPRSILYNLEMARRPKSNNSSVPHTHETLTQLIRILKNAVTPASEAIAANPGSINIESKMFKSYIGFDDPSREFFRHVRFELVEQRYSPPEPTPENVQFLNRCRFQLELSLTKSKQDQPRYVLQDIWHGTDNDIKLDYACDFILKKLGVKYDRYQHVKPLDMTKEATLKAEHRSPYKVLGCLSDMNDRTIINTFQTQVSHDTTIAHRFVDALVEVQKLRKSEALFFEIVCQRSQGIVTGEELKQAYRDFEIPVEGNISDEILLGLVRATLHTNSRENLKIIAKARNNPEINRLVEEPSTDYTLEDGDLLQYYAQTPVGLSNIGNTCYLNSLLQYIYTIKEIRESVLNMEAYIENEDAEDWKPKVVDGRTLSRQY
ncbi:ubiquitin-specific protease ubp2, partial [Modicella reniformis]